MSTFAASNAAFEAWLGAQLDGRLVADDLRHKHRRMARDPHAFLRATCFRFAEIAPALPGKLMQAPRVVAVGDAHVENFGLWRDIEGRLVWGVNDLDEAAFLPWPLDLVRLGASAVLAGGDRGPAGREVAEALLGGYRAGLAAPAAHVLVREHVWLRDAFQASDTERRAFWQKIDALWTEPDGDARPDAKDRAALRASLPADCRGIAFAPRRAGLGSLGRPRFVARASLAGAPVLREMKTRVPSCFVFAGLAPAARGTSAIRRMAAGRFRCPDPWFAVTDGRVIRRLAPDSRKIEGEALAGALAEDLVAAMAFEIASLHAGDAAAAAARADAAARKPGWLAAAVEALAATTVDEHAGFVAASGPSR